MPSRRWPALLACALALAAGACDPDPGGADGGGPDTGEATLDGASPSCATPLGGDAPFAARLGGAVDLYDLDGAFAEAREEHLDAWLPEGSEPGARAWISHAVRWPYEAVAAVEVTLDADGTAPFVLRGSDGADLALDGMLVAPGGGALVELERNLASPATDVGRGARGRAMLCASGAAPGAELRWVDAESGPPLSPLSTLRLGPTSPWASAPAVEVQAGGAPVAVSATEEALEPGWDMTPIQLLALRPLAAFPPGRAIELHAAGADVLGRDYALIGSHEVLSTSAVLTDGSFETPPPEGAVAGEARVVEGRLELGDRIGETSLRPTRVMIALGEPPAAAARLRLSHELACSPARGAPLRVGLVAGDGAASVIELACPPEGASGLGTAALDVPGPGPLFLVLDRDTRPDRPQWGPSYAWVAARVDELRFE